MSNQAIGSLFDEFLEEQGVLEQTHAVAIKRVLAWQIQQAMEEQHMSKVAMAERMHTSRSQLDRLLDPDQPGIQLDTLERAAEAVGRRLRVELV